MYSLHETRKRGQDGMLRVPPSQGREEGVGVNFQAILTRGETVDGLRRDVLSRCVPSV